MESTKIQDYDMILKGLGALMASLFADMSIEEADHYVRMGAQLVITVTTVAAFFKKYKKRKKQIQNG